jgi:hypothetical protein
LFDLVEFNLHCDLHKVERERERKNNKQKQKQKQKQYILNFEKDLI